MTHELLEITFVSYFTFVYWYLRLRIKFVIYNWKIMTRSGSERGQSPCYQRWAIRWYICSEHSENEITGNVCTWISDPCSYHCSSCDHEDQILATNKYKAREKGDTLVSPDLRTYALSMKPIFLIDNYRQLQI